jgi:hypothetical protein
MSRPVVVSQTRTVASSDDVAMTRPFALKAMWVMGWAWFR